MPSGPILAVDCVRTVNGVKYLALRGGALPQTIELRAIESYTIEFVNSTTAHLVVVIGNEKYDRLSIGLADVKEFTDALVTLKITGR